MGNRYGKRSALQSNSAIGDFPMLPLLAGTHVFLRAILYCNRFDRSISIMSIGSLFCMCERLQVCKRCLSFRSVTQRTLCDTVCANLESVTATLQNHISDFWLYRICDLMYVNCIC